MGSVKKSSPSLCVVSMQWDLAGLGVLGAQVLGLALRVTCCLTPEVSGLPALGLHGPLCPVKCLGSSPVGREGTSGLWGSSA